MAGGGTADNSAAEAWEWIQYRFHDRRNAFSVLSGQRTFFPGLCLGIVIFIYAAVTVYQNFPELLQQYQQLYEMYQGGM